MSCGAIGWWREPDLKGLLERHGQVEHLVVQFDFLVQVWRDARAEYAIPRASKSGSGGTGYADIASIASGEIWEIKPKHLEGKAVDEARHYVQHALASCGKRWKAGKSYTTSGVFKGKDVVYRVSGKGNTAELIAQQAGDGAVIYFWRINGKEVSSLTPYFAWAVRGQIIEDFFPSQLPQPLPGARAPGNFPPVKFKPPVLRPDACIPQLGGVIPALRRSIETTCMQTILEGGAVAILLEAAVFDALVGPAEVARQMSMMQVKPNASSEKAFAIALDALQRAAGPNATIANAMCILRTVGLMIGAAVVVGGVILVTIEAAPLLVQAAAPAAAAGGLAGTFGLSVASSQALRMAVATGVTLVAFAIPRTSRADPASPVAIDAAFARFVVLKPGQAGQQLGASTWIEGVQYRLAGLARTDPA